LTARPPRGEWHQVNSLYIYIDYFVKGARKKTLKNSENSASQGFSGDLDPAGAAFGEGRPRVFNTHSRLFMAAL
jgi:hypothetical protein